MSNRNSNHYAITENYDSPRTDGRRAHGPFTPEAARAFIQAVDYIDDSSIGSIGIVSADGEEAALRKAKELWPC